MRFERKGTNWKMWLGPLFFCGGKRPYWFGFRIFNRGLAFSRNGVEYLDDCSVRNSA